jgi:hypothetical protein
MMNSVGNGWVCDLAESVGIESSALLWWDLGEENLGERGVGRVEGFSLKGR